MTPSLMKYNPAFLDDATLIRSFVARTAELERIVEVLRENSAGSNQHLLIIGPRGIGKTTLVRRVVAEVHTDATLGERWYPIVFGEETYQASTAGEFWLEALFHLGQQTGEMRWQKAYEELLHERDDTRLRQRVLAQLLDFADEQGKRLVLVVENLNMLVGSQMSADDAWVLRHTLMNEPRLMLLGTATSRFKEMEEYNQALYELFRILELEPLDQAEAQALWTETTGQATSARQIRPLQILTGGNPRLIRILSEFAASTSFRSLMDELTRLVDEHTEYFKHHLDNLPPQERKVFVVLADLWDPATARQVAEAARVDVNTASALLKRLIDRGAVTAPYKRGRAQFYQVAERMYNIYHLMRRRGPAASRVHAVVRFMVHFYPDEELVRRTRSLVEEASRLPVDQRHEHLAAFGAILNHAQKRRLAEPLIEVARSALETMPDVPEWIRRIVGESSSLHPEKGPDADSNGEEDLSVLRVEDVTEVETLLRLGNYLSNQPGREADAEAALRKAIEIDPSHIEALRALGGFLFTRKRLYQKALESFDRALALDAESVGTWSARGLILLLLRRYEEALESSDRALALDAESAVAWTGRGLTLLLLSRYEEALESFDRELALDTESVGTWTARGLALLQLGRYEEALESFDRVLALDAEDAWVLLARAKVLRRLMRFEEAESDLRRASVRGKWQDNAVLDLVELLLKDMRRPDRAIVAAREGLDRIDSSAEGLNRLAWNFFAHGRREDFHEAETWARRAVEEAPTVGAFRQTLACLLGAQGKWKEALKQASAFLADRTMLTTRLNEVIDFFIDAIAAGYEDEILDIVQRADHVEALEPLVVAIHRLRGDEVDVAREIWEVAEDVLKRIEARQQDVQEQ